MSDKDEMMLDGTRNPPHGLFNNRWITAVALLFLTAGAVFTPLLKRAFVTEKLDRVRRDYKDLEYACRKYGSDNCGVSYPCDTRFSRLEDPSVPLTFETSVNVYRKYAKNIGGSLLTTPVAYLKSLPRDPFRNHGYYGYYTENSNIRSLAILNSPGPDGVEDFPLAEVGQKLDRYQETRPGGGAITNEERWWIRSMIDPYLYDPSNGTISRGDLVMVMDSCRITYGFGAPLPDMEYQNPPRPAYPISFELSNTQHWDVDAQQPPPLSYQDKLWSEALTSMPGAFFFQVLEPAGLILVGGELRTNGYTTDSISSLHGNFGPFLDFFQHPKALTSTQIRELKVWRARNSFWWRAMDKPIKLQENHSVYSIAYKAYELYPLIVLYGKCQLLKAASLVAENKKAQARQHIEGLEQLLDYLRKTWHHPKNLYVERVQSELGRMCMELKGYIAREQSIR